MTQQIRSKSPFCTLSHSKKISSPPLQLPELRLTLQIFSSAVLGAPMEGKKTYRLMSDDIKAAVRALQQENGEVVVGKSERLKARFH